MYRITIEKIEQKKVVRSSWTKLREPFQDEKEIALYNEKRYEDAPQYGYVDKEIVENVNTEVFDQTVDDLDLTAVIKAVNKIN